MDYGVIFDMDGVLVDSTMISWDSFNQVLKPRGVQFGREEIKPYLGMSLRDIVADLNSKYGWNLDFAEFTQASWAIQLELFKKSKADEGLVKLLKELKAMSVPMAVGTSSQRFRADKVLELLGITDYFSSVVTANDVTEHKPNPHLFLEAARRINRAPNRCVVIEDATNGIEAAKRAGMKVVGYLNKYNGAESIAQADVRIDSFENLCFYGLANLIEGAYGKS